MTDNGGKDPHHLPVLYANTSEGPLSLNIAIQLTAHELPGYAVWSGIGWLLDTQAQLVGLTGFCLFGKTLMDPPLMALNICWGGRPGLCLLTPA